MESSEGEPMSKSNTVCFYASPPLSRQVLVSFAGKIVYSTPGSGKTTLVNQYRQATKKRLLVDGDVTILSVIKTLSPEFVPKRGKHIGPVLCTYFDLYPNTQAAVFELVVAAWKDEACRGKTVLIGSVKQMQHADFVFVADGLALQPRKRFNRKNELKQIDVLITDKRLDNGRIVYIDSYLSNYIMQQL